MKKLTIEQKASNFVLREEGKQHAAKLKDKSFYWRGKSALQAWIEAHR